MTDERKKRIDNVLLKRQNDLTVILENVNDPHNISAVMRSCDAVGITEIFVLNTVIPKHQRFDPKTSSSALKWMKVHQFTDVATCMKEVKSRYKKIYSTHLNEESKDMYSLNLTEPVALVFGNERVGITQETLAFCDANFIIPQVGMIQSLNISVACAVTIYEAYRQKTLAGHYEQKKLNPTEEKSLKDYWKIIEVE